MVCFSNKYIFSALCFCHVSTIQRQTAPKKSHLDFVDKVEVKLRLLYSYLALLDSLLCPIDADAQPNYK